MDRNVCMHIYVYVCIFFGYECMDSLAYACEISLINYAGSRDALHDMLRDTLHRCMHVHTNCVYIYIFMYVCILW